MTTSFSPALFGSLRLALCRLFPFLNRRRRLTISSLYCLFTLTFFRTCEYTWDLGAEVVFRMDESSIYFGPHWF